MADQTGWWFDIEATGYTCKELSERYPLYVLDYKRPALLIHSRRQKGYMLYAGGMDSIISNGSVYLSTAMGLGYDQVLGSLGFTWPMSSEGREGLARW